MASPQTESQSFAAAIKQLAAERFLWLVTEHTAKHAGLDSVVVPETHELGKDAQQFVRDGVRGEIAGDVYEMLKPEGGVPRADELTSALVEAYPEFCRLVHTAGFTPSRSRELKEEYKTDVLNSVSKHMRIHVERSMKEAALTPLVREKVGPRSAGLSTLREAPGLQISGPHLGPRSSGINR